MTDQKPSPCDYPGCEGHAELHGLCDKHIDLVRAGDRATLETLLGPVHFVALAEAADRAAFPMADGYGVVDTVRRMKPLISRDELRRVIVHALQARTAPASAGAQETVHRPRAQRTGGKEFAMTRNAEKCLTPGCPYNGTNTIRGICPKCQAAIKRHPESPDAKAALAARLPNRQGCGGRAGMLAKAALAGGAAPAGGIGLTVRQRVKEIRLVQRAEELRRRSPNPAGEPAPVDPPKLAEPPALAAGSPPEPCRTPGCDGQAKHRGICERCTNQATRHPGSQAGRVATAAQLPSQRGKWKAGLALDVAAPAHPPGAPWPAHCGGAPTAVMAEVPAQPPAAKMVTVPLDAMGAKGAGGLGPPPPPELPTGGTPVTLAEYIAEAVELIACHLGLTGVHCAADDDGAILASRNDRIVRYDHGKCLSGRVVWDENDAKAVRA